MRCLEVTLNGERYCLAGTDPVAMISASVTHGAPDDVVERDKTALTVLGLTGDATNDYYWGDEKFALAVGDVVTIRVVDETGTTVPTGSPGEIVIRGPNVMREYENNPKANADAFYDGWFRTGDQGVMDEDGYVSIVGRLKEIINRGGEKIAPREIDEVLMDHPAVAEALSFALTHDKLGEEVAACVVLHEGRDASEDELRRFVAVKLADFKVPRRVVVLSDIPKGPTGKLQRIGLARRLGLER